MRDAQRSRNQTLATTTTTRPSSSTRPTRAATSAPTGRATAPVPTGPRTNRTTAPRAPPRPDKTARNVRYNGKYDRTGVLGTPELSHTAHVFVPWAARHLAPLHTYTHGHWTLAPQRYLGMGKTNDNTPATTTAQTTTMTHTAAHTASTPTMHSAPPAAAPSPLNIPTRTAARPPAAPTATPSPPAYMRTWCRLRCGRHRRSATQPQLSKLLPHHPRDHIQQLTLYRKYTGKHNALPTTTTTTTTTNNTTTTTTTTTTT